MKIYIIAFAVLISLAGCKDKQDQQAVEEKAAVQEVTEVATDVDPQPAAIDFKVTPIMHASMVLGWNEQTIYVDPVGDASLYQGQPDADLILITDIHRDHMDLQTLQALTKEHTRVVVPKAVADSLGQLQTELVVLNNGQTTQELGMNIEAIPMYNLRDEALRFHPKGRGNGYVLEQEGFRTYISGDTEGTPEMLGLQNIDVAFISVNLPYTMSEKQAAEAVAKLQPKTVYPYHYRGSIGLSNMKAFKLWLEKQEGGQNVEVVQLDWYPTN